MAAFKMRLPEQTEPVFRIQPVDPDPAGPTKIEKSQEISCFEVLDVLYSGMKASPLAWTSFLEYT